MAEENQVTKEPQGEAQQIMKEPQRVEERSKEKRRTIEI